MGKIINIKKFKEILLDLKKKIVVTNGCFDIVHYGHIKIFKKSKELGDVLIVLVNSDSSIKKIKGPNRPIISLKPRLNLLSSIKYIDYIIPFNHTTPTKLYQIIKPNFLTKGSQYKKKEIAGSKIIEKNNGKIKLIKMIPGISTSKIIKKIKS